MIIRNGRDPKGFDMGPSEAPHTTGYGGTFAVAKAQTSSLVPDDRNREKGKFARLEDENPEVAKKRRQWREAQIRYKQKKDALKLASSG